MSISKRFSSRPAVTPAKLSFFVFMFSPALLLAIFLTSCAMISDPENSGGEIIAVPEGPWCQFNLSQNAQWLQFVGTGSPYYQSEEPHQPFQRSASFVNLQTGEIHDAKPDAGVQKMIAKGLGPDGLGCFSPDQSTVYYTRTIRINLDRSENHSEAAAPEQNNNNPQTALSTPSHQLERYYYAVDLTQKPLTVVQVSRAECADNAVQTAEMTNIRVEKPSEKRILIYSNDGTLLAEHKPRGLLSKRISVYEPPSFSGDRAFQFSPDGKYIAYIILEGNYLNFSAPSQGHLTSLQAGSERSSSFLAASVYSMRWSKNGDLYACTSHKKYRRAIARWSP